MRISDRTSSLSVSTWSLHRTLGKTYPDAPGLTERQVPALTYGEGTCRLLELPAKLAAFGIHTLEICHFHLPSREESYLTEVREALSAANVRLFSLLVDAGDVSDPVHTARDTAWIAEWITIAGTLGAERARVIGGKSPYSADAMQRSQRAFRELAAVGAAANVRITTENWYPLLSRPEYLRELLDSLDGQVGLCFDFGNWGGDTKYNDLDAIAPYAESCHAKCAFVTPMKPDRDDFLRCLDITRTHGFTGPYTLIYDGPDDEEWSGLALERELLQPYLAV